MHTVHLLCIVLIFSHDMIVYCANHKVGKEEVKSLGVAVIQESFQKCAGFEIPPFVFLFLLKENKEFQFLKVG